MYKNRLKPISMTLFAMGDPYLTFFKSCVSYLTFFGNIIL